MKIVYPYPMHISKGYTYMLSIIQFLNTLANFTSVDLLCLDDKATVSKYLKVNLGIELSKNLNIIQISNKRFGIKSNKFFFIKRTIQHLNKIKSERIIFYTRDLKQMRLCIKKIKNSSRNVEFIFEAHQILSKNYERDNNIKQSLRMRKLESFVFSNIDCLVCITETLSQDIKKSFVNCPTNHLILPVGFNKKFLLINHKNNKYDILYAGNFSKWKGLDSLLEAISLIKQTKYKDISVVLIGADKNSKKYYEDKSKSLGLVNNITILNRIKHRKIYQYLSESKIGVVPTSSKGDGLLYTSPLKLYEYLGSGIKVVSSRLPSIESNIPDDIVYYSNPDDPESLASSIVLALEDKNFNSDKVKNFAKKYTWDKRAVQFLDFIS
jgi:glycosyltransferase involved in cell wall biosynthesis